MSLVIFPEQTLASEETFAIDGNQTWDVMQGTDFISDWSKTYEGFTDCGAKAKELAFVYFRRNLSPLRESHSRWDNSQIYHVYIVQANSERLFRSYSPVNGLVAGDAPRE